MLRASTRYIGEIFLSSRPQKNALLGIFRTKIFCFNNFARTKFSMRCFSQNPNIPEKSTDQGDHKTKPHHYLKEFYLKVHPDLFSYNELYRRVNQDSLANLNSLLDYAGTVRKCVQTNRFDDPALTQAPLSLTLSFYCLTVIDKNGNRLAPNLVLVDFAHQKSPRTPEEAAEMLGSFERMLGRLIVKAGVSVPNFLEAQWTEDATESPKEDIALSRSARRRSLRSKESVVYTYCFQGPGFAEGCPVRGHEELGRWEEVACFEPIHGAEVHFHPGDAALSPELGTFEKTRALWKFSEAVQGAFKEMKCTQWIGSIVFFHRYSKRFFEPQSAVFFVPWDFNTRLLIDYFREYTTLAIEEGNQARLQGLPERDRSHATLEALARGPDLRSQGGAGPSEADTEAVHPTDDSSLDSLTTHSTHSSHDLSVRAAGAQAPDSGAEQEKILEDLMDVIKKRM